MKNNTYQFIIHVVYNLFPLHEYSEGELRNLMAKFKEEADDLNIQIEDDQLKSYINRFDQLKNSPKITEKDLRKYSLSQLIKLVSKSAGADVPEEADITPDVVYNNDDNTIVIYNGSKEGNCINFGQGEKWCITRGSYGNYRYSRDRGYPTFYLAKNNNLPSSDKLSFVAIQVRDTPDESERYVYTNRVNSPYESDPMNFSSLLSEVPWLNSIPNIKNILKYIPLSSTEKSTQLYSKEAISIRDWSQLPFETKKQYLVVRKDKNLFDDISNGEFVNKYLSEYPQLATFISTNNGIIDDEILLKYLGVFSNQDRKSIIANMRNLVPLNLLNKDTFSFDVKKLLVKLNKWDLNSDQRIYVTKDDKAIILITLGDNIKVGVFTEDADYPNIKLNKRTSRFLVDYPELDKIPFKILAKLVADEVIDKSLLDKVIEKAKENPDSSFIVKDTEDGLILIDANTFTSYKIKDNKVSPILFTSDEVQNILSSEENNSSLQTSVLGLLKSNIPSSIDKETFESLLNSTPVNQRKTEIGGTQYDIIYIPNNAILLVNKSDREMSRLRVPYYHNLIPSNSNWRNKREGESIMDDEDELRAYFEYLRGEGVGYNTEQLLQVINNAWGTAYRKNILKSNPPLTADNTYRIIVTDDSKYLLLNRNDSRQSKMLSGRTGRLINANIPPRVAAQYLGTPTVPQQAADAGEAPRRRGRPAGATRQAQPQPAQGAVNDEVVNALETRGINRGFNSLPQSVKNTLLSGTITRLYGDRGATRRDRALRGYGGRVINVITSGQSKLYFVQLNSGTVIGSVAIQPGGQHYIVTADSAFRIPNANEFVNQLRQRNLNENAKVILALHAEANPKEMKELKTNLTEKKADRCKRIADRRYDKPSAYKSGAIVRCRQGKIWKDLK